MMRRLLTSARRRAWLLWFRLAEWVYLPESSLRLAERFLRKYHQHLFKRDWGGWRQLPDWYDHRIDLFTWSQHRNGHWVERGIYSAQVMRPGCTVLDLSCGDGFYPYYFFTEIAEAIDAIDMDPRAITHCRKYHAHQKIHYVCADIITNDFPRDRYDVVTWDGAIGHFSPAEIEAVMKKIAKALGASGVLTGYEELQTEEERSWDHKIAIDSAEAMRRLLGRFFSHVRILTSNSPGRRNAYFRCSQDPGRLTAFE